METFEKTSKTLYVIKAFAILFTITAHMSFSQEYFLADTIRTAIGQIGVPTFFIVSGYFYSRKPGDNKSFWLKKFKNLFIPWLIFSIIIFSLSEFVFGTPGNLIVDFLCTLTGISSIFWYLTVMCIIMFLFYYIKKDSILYACIAISIVSVLASGISIIIFDANYINQFFNIFNWIGFFALGMLLRKKDLLKKLISPLITVISGVLMALFVAIAGIRGEVIHAYVDITSLFIEISGFLFFLNISYLLSDCNLLVDIGKKSFFVYLMHIQTVGIINTRLPYNVLFFILRPVIGLAVCYVVAVVFKFMLNKLKLGKYSFVFGLDR